MRETTRITSVRIPDKVKQDALVESGYRCAVPRCTAEWPSLHFHPLDEGSQVTTSKEMLVLCPAHLEMVTAGEIGSGPLRKLKEVLVAFRDFDASEISPIRNRLLYSLAGELYVNINILQDRKFQQLNADAGATIVYPRLLRTVLDESIASGVFVHAHDRDLFQMLHTWSEIVNEFNRRLDITELRCLAVVPSATSAPAPIIDRRGVDIARDQCRGLAVYLIEEYGTEAGLDFSTLFADTGLFPRQG